MEINDDNYAEVGSLEDTEPALPALKLQGFCRRLVTTATSIEHKKGIFHGHQGKQVFKGFLTELAGIIAQATKNTSSSLSSDFTVGNSVMPAELYLQ